MPIRCVTDQQAIMDNVHAFLDEWNAPTDFIEVNTSGSTGAPKRIQIQKTAMISSARATGEFLGISEGDTALLSLSMETVAGKMMVVRALVLNLNLCVGDVSTDPLNGIIEPIHFAAMVPMQLLKILDTNPTSLENVEQLILGGGPVSPGLIERIQGLPTKIYHTFGMTETVSHIALRRLNRPLEMDFHCLPGVNVREREGQLIIDAPILGVHDLETNDAVILTSPTSFHWLGRTDFVINSGGIKFHPEQIETKLTALLPYPFFICGEPDEILGEKVVLILEHSETLSLSKSDFSPYLDPYSIPKIVRYVPKFTYTASGKINRLISKNTENVAFEVL